MGYRTPALPPMNPFFYDPCELLDTKDITEGAITRPEQMFGPMQSAASEVMRAFSKVPFEPALFEFTSEVQMSPLREFSPISGGVFGPSRNGHFPITVYEAYRIT